LKKIEIYYYNYNIKRMLKESIKLNGESDIQYITLDARGVMIKITHEIAKKIPVLKAYIEYGNEKPYYLNYSAETVHNLIDYMSGRMVYMEKIKYICGELCIDLTGDLMENLSKDKSENNNLISDFRIIARGTEIICPGIVLKYSDYLRDEIIKSENSTIVCDYNPFYINKIIDYLYNDDLYDMLKNFNDDISSLYMIRTICKKWKISLIEYDDIQEDFVDYEKYIRELYQFCANHKIDFNLINYIGSNEKYKSVYDNYYNCLIGVCSNECYFSKKMNRFCKKHDDYDWDRFYKIKSLYFSSLSYFKGIHFIPRSITADIDLLKFISYEDKQVYFIYDFKYEIDNSYTGVYAINYKNGSVEYFTAKKFLKKYSEE